MNKKIVTKKSMKLKKEFKKVQVSYSHDLAFEFLYLFEDHCPKNRDIANHIRAIEGILQSLYFVDKNCNFIDEVEGYELYLVGHDYE